MKTTEYNRDLVIDWLTNNRGDILLYLKGVKEKGKIFKNRKLLKEFEIISGYLEAWKNPEEMVFTADRSGFFVIIEHSKSLSYNLISNYVTRALKRWHTKDEVTDWFSGGVQIPTFRIQQVKITGVQYKDIRDVVKELRQAKDLLSPVYQDMEE